MAAQMIPGAVPADRLRGVLFYINERESAKVDELAAHFAVSAATVRRDLDELARQGLVQRTHGGALTLRPQSAAERAFGEKLSLQQEEKIRIAAAAAREVREGDTVLLDSGTTAYQLALRLAEKKNLTIVTHDLYLAANIEFDASTTVVVTGGVKRASQNVLVGGMVEQFLSTLRGDVAFLTADAVSAVFGVSNANFFEAGIKRALVRAAKRVVLIADHTKTGKNAVVQVCGLDAVDLFITDDGLPGRERTALAEKGVRLELV